MSLNTVAPSCTTSAREHTAGAVPSISVVLSTRNRAEQLPAALERLLSQSTSVRYEVVVVDNDSTDATGRVIERAAREHPHLVRAGFEPRRGVSHGRNKGISLSRASIVAFTDDDVLVSPDWLQRVVDAMEAHPDVSCVGGRVLPIWTTPPPQWLTPQHWSPLALVDYGDQPFYVDRDRAVCLVTANVAYRRAALDAIGWFSPEFPRGQDHELLLRFWRAGLRGLYLPDLVVMCEVPESRLTWAYHRRWHATHGRFLARMDGDGEVVQPSHTPRTTLFGSPASVYRELASSVGRYVVQRLSGRKADARHAEGRARDRAAFIAARARMWRSERRSPVGEIVRFVAACQHRLRTNR
jgi:glucosyl-dolichyl phosphate glucuronosyltransferase